MIRNLLDTFSILGFLAGMSFSLVLLTKFPVTGFLIVLFIVVFCLVTLVNASSDDKPSTD